MTYTPRPGMVPVSVSPHPPARQPTHQCGTCGLAGLGKTTPRGQAAQLCTLSPLPGPGCVGMCLSRRCMQVSSSQYARPRDNKLHWQEFWRPAVIRSFTGLAVYRSAPRMDNPSCVESTHKKRLRSRKGLQLGGEPSPWPRPPWSWHGRSCLGTTDWLIDRLRSAWRQRAKRCFR